MQTNQTTENIEKTNHHDLISIFKIAGFAESLFESWCFVTASVLSLLLIGICLCFEVDKYEFLILIVDDIISFLPNILGFTITGYALVVGFVQPDVLERITEKEEDSDYSLYQTMSSSFAVTILIQAISLITAFTFRYIDFISSKVNYVPQISTLIITFINTIGLAIIIFCLAFSLMMVIQIILNIFSFSQIHHYLINKDKISKKPKDPSA